VLATVELNDKPEIETSKIDNVGANRHLPLEFESTKTMSPKAIPKAVLCVGHIPS
jgi:hypothetical protein